MITGIEIAQAIGLTKAVAKVAHETGKIPEYQQILELQGMLLEIQQAHFEMQTRIQELESENKALKEKFHTASKMVHKHNAYYDGEDGPFCMACWDDKQKKIRLETKADNSYAKCKVCKSEFKIREDKGHSISFDSTTRLNSHNF